MIFLLILLCSNVARASLQAEFSGFVAQFAEHYPRPELRLRLALFEKAKTEMAKHNANPDRSWSMAINRFSAMTPEERAQYVGLRNVTEAVESEYLQEVSRPSLGSNPASVDHVAGGLVTKPKDQRTCGSCWAFTAAAAFEGAYAQATGVLKSFSEKELLDCTYERFQDDGCKGGTYGDAWIYIRKSGRLAALKDAPYDYAKDGKCSYEKVANGIKNAKIDPRSRSVRQNDQALEDAAAQRVIAVSMIMEDDFMKYGSGIFDGCKDNTKAVGHGITLVGYTKAVWKVKNSFGTDWGEKGYVRFSRARANICRLTEYARYPVVQRDPRGEKDEADPAGERRRWPDYGCRWGDDYPCSDLNCSYGCKEGKCWSQCNGICVIVGRRDRCANCDEWCWLDASCKIHEDCAAVRYEACHSACSL